MSTKRSFKEFTARLSEIGLLAGTEMRSLALHVSLNDLYEGPAAPSVTAARRAVYTWLASQGKGNNEIARLFDRAPSGIFKLMNARRSKKRASKSSRRSGA